MRFRASSCLVWLAIFLLGLVAAMWLRQGVLIALNDSQDNNWGAARALLNGQDPYKLYLQCGNCAEPPFRPPVAPMYPASALVMLWPLAMLSWPAAKAAWAGLNILLGAGMAATLHRLFLPQSGWRGLATLLLLLLASRPFLTNLHNGQHAIFALAFFPAALWAERRNRPVLASVFLAISWFKYTLTLPLSLFFVFRGRLALLLGAAAIQGALILFAAAWTGSSPWDLLVEPLRVAQQVTSVGHLELFGLATRLGIASKLPPLACAVALTLAVLTAILRGRSEDDLELLCLLSLFAYAVVYHYPYDLVILVIPLCYVLSRARSWEKQDRLERAWSIMLGVLLGWIWYADHPVQILKKQGVSWVIGVYSAYYLALAIWFYATIFLGIAVVGRRRRNRESAEMGSIQVLRPN